MSASVDSSPGEYAIRVVAPDQYIAQKMNFLWKARRYLHIDQYIGVQDIWKIHSTITSFYAKPSDFERETALKGLRETLTTVGGSTKGEFSGMTYSPITALQKRIDRAVGLIGGEEQITQEVDDVAAALMHTIASAKEAVSGDVLRAPLPTKGAIRSEMIGRVAIIVSQQLIQSTALKLKEELKRTSRDQKTCNELLVNLGLYLDNFVNVFGPNCLWLVGSLLQDIGLFAPAFLEVVALNQKAVAHNQKQLLFHFLSMWKTFDFSGMDDVVKIALKRAQQGDGSARQLLTDAANMLSEAARHEVGKIPALEIEPRILTQNPVQDALDMSKLLLQKATDIWKKLVPSPDKMELARGWLALYEGEFRHPKKEGERDVSLLNQYIAKNFQGTPPFSPEDMHQAIRDSLKFLADQPDLPLLVAMVCEYPEDALALHPIPVTKQKQDLEERALEYCKQLIDRIHRESGENKLRDTAHLSRVREALEKVFPQISHVVERAALEGAEVASEKGVVGQVGANPAKAWFDGRVKEWENHSTNALQEIAQEGDERKAIALAKRLEKELLDIQGLFPDSPGRFRLPVIKVAKTLADKLNEATTIAPIQEAGSKCKRFLKVMQTLGKSYDQEALDQFAKVSLEQNVLKVLVDDLFEKIVAQLPLDTQEKLEGIDRELPSFEALVRIFKHTRSHLLPELIQRYGQTIALGLLENSRKGGEGASSEFMDSFLKRATAPFAGDMLKECFSEYVSQILKKLQDTHPLEERIALWNALFDDAQRRWPTVGKDEFVSAVREAIGAQDLLQNVIKELRADAVQKLEKGDYKGAEEIMEKAFALASNAKSLLGKLETAPLPLPSEKAVQWPVAYGEFLSSKMALEEVFGDGLEELYFFQQRCIFFLGSDVTDRVLESMNSSLPWATVRRVVPKVSEEIQKAALEGNVEELAKIHRKLEVFKKILGKEKAIALETALGAAFTEYGKALVNRETTGEDVIEVLFRYERLIQSVERNFPDLSSEIISGMTASIDTSLLGERVKEEGALEYETILDSPSTQMQQEKLDTVVKKWLKVPRFGVIALRALRNTLEAKLGKQWQPLLAGYIHKLQGQRSVYGQMPEHAAEYKALEEVFPEIVNP